MPCRFLHHPYGLSSVCIERSTLANTKENVVASSFSSPEPRVNSSCSERFSSSRSSNFSYCTAFLTTGRRGEEVVCGEKYGGRTVVAWTLSNKISCGRCYRSFKRFCLEWWGGQGYSSCAACNSTRDHLKRQVPGWKKEYLLWTIFRGKWLVAIHQPKPKQAINRDITVPWKWGSCVHTQSRVDVLSRFWLDRSVWPFNWGR